MSADLLSPGAVVDRYTVEALLGRGGMAVVYRVRHNKLATLHALKVLTIPSASIRERLLQEGHVQALLKHPNIVNVSDVVDVAGAPGLVMEYVRGPSLDALAQQRPLTRAQVDLIVRGILAGVQAAHARGLIHRDLKPANVMIAVSEASLTPKITDFGLAKVLDADEGGGSHRTRSGATMGTPAYMPPEQIRDAKKVDARADLWSVGVLMYQLLTGRLPFESDDLIETYKRIGDGQYTPVRELAPDVPDRMARAVEAALVVDRDRRVPDCAALTALWTGESGEARGESVWDTAELVAVRDLGGGGEESILRPSYQTGVASGGGARGGGGASADPSIALTTPPPSLVDAPAPSAGGGRWGLLVAGVVIVMFAVGASVAASVALLSWWLVYNPAPSPAPVVMTPSSPLPERASPVAEDVRSPPPVPDAPTAVPTPVSRPVVAVEAPKPPEPSPPPSTVVLEPAAAPADSGLATVRVDGDVSRVYLRPVGGGAPLTPGPIPPGTYTVDVFFGAEPVTVREITVSAGQELSMKCSQAMRVCR